MKYDVSKLNNWQKTKEYELPGIIELFNNTASDIMIIGAAVFELYELQRWIPALKRKTGDIDLSVGIVSNDSNYQFAKTILVKHNYKQDEYLPYRYQDIDNVRSELIKRSFASEFVDTTLIQRLSDFHERLI